MAQYLPVLLVSVLNPAPDDNSLDTQAVGQVDYLSHDWQEEDVAKSWRNMTRRKDSIQNGARLENASWRTWWKRRNNLPTVTPETLNWLKDSDVTWLYGPLHTAAEWVPPPRQATPSTDRSATSSPASPSFAHSTLHPSADIPSGSSRSDPPWALKPILKHRSISELLSISLPSSPGSELLELESNQYFASRPNPNDSSTSKITPVGDVLPSDNAQKRPKLTHTKSDSTVHQRNSFWRDSPPPLGNVASSELLSSLSLLTHSQPRSRDSSVSDSANTQKRHISFNTFVEQCIAIEKPNKAKDGFHEGDEEGEEDDDPSVDEEDGYREDDEGSENEEDDESEDDVLEMRSSSRSRGCGSRRTPPLSTASSAPSGWNDLSGVGSEREHVTIAPIAPTVLKTSGSLSPAGSFYHRSYGSPWEEDEQEDDAFFVPGRQYVKGTNLSTERRDSVNLVYVPPHGSAYAERIPGSGGTAGGSVPGAGGAKAFEFPLSSPPHATRGLGASFDDVDLLVRRDDAVPEAGLDFFGGPDMGPAEVYDSYRSGLKRGGRSPAQLRSVDLGSVSLSDITSRNTGNSKGSSGSVSEEGTVVPPSLPLASSPRLEVLKAQRDARPSSPVYVVPHHVVPPSPSAAIPVPRQIAHTHTHVNQSLSPAPSSTSTSTSSTGGSGSGASYGSPLLEPPMRGRSTSPITSVSVSGDSARGRSGTRGSSMSISDVERSVRGKEEREPQRGRSRSRSNGTGSPLDGSVSPRSGSHCRLGPSARRATFDGGVTIGLGGYGTTYRLGASPTWKDKSLSPEDGEAGRSGRMNRSVKRSMNGGESSLSSPNIVREQDAMVINGRDVPISRPPLHVPETAEVGIVQHVEDVTRSLNPPLSNSPTSALKPLVPPPPPTVAANATSAPAAALPSHARSPLEETATLVGRASEIVSSAKGYLGSFWGSERQLPHPRDGPRVSNILGSR